MDVKEKFIYKFDPNERIERWWYNFTIHCNTIATKNDWMWITVANHQLGEIGGRLITTSTHGQYLRWDDESAFTMFVLKWT